MSTEARTSEKQLCKHDWAGDDACAYCGWEETSERCRVLLDALEKNAATFEDFSKGLRLLERPLLAEACDVALKATLEAIEWTP